MTPFTHPCLPSNVSAVLTGDNIYLTVKSPEWLEIGRVFHRETTYCVNRIDFACAADELPQPCHINILLPALESRLVSEGLVSKPVKEAA